MAEGEERAAGQDLSEEMVAELSAELGCAAEEVRAMSETRLAWVLNKREIPDRPRARIEQEMGALRGDDGEVPSDALSRALGQLDRLRSASHRTVRDVAGVPTGATLFALTARIEGPTAGLNANNTGWTALGPGNIGGRTRGLVIDPTNTARIFAAGVGGGVWRSPDGGATWAPTDDLMANLAVCSLVMHPTDPNRLYAGTGEGFFNIGAIRGDGIFETQDGGVTWTRLAATGNNADFRFVNALAISSNGQTLLAGTTTGLLRSTNQGLTWTRELNVPIGNLAFDPSDSSNAIAGGLSNGNAYVSTDGGDTWQTANRPSAAGGRVQVCYAVADSQTVYASVEANPSQIWRSTDGGQNYQAQAANVAGGAAANFLGRQGWYDNVIWAGDPTDVDLVLVGGIDLWRSTDGGDTLTQISTWWSDQSAHADHHAIVADPGYNGTTNRRVYFGNDGGVHRADNVTTVGNNASAPFTNGWVNLNNGYGVTQFYYAAGHLGSNTIVGGTQDNGTLRYTPSQGANAWNEVFGGDGGDVASDPRDPNLWYGEYVTLQIFRNTNGGASRNQTDYICGRRWNGAQWVWKPAPFLIPDARDGQALFIAPFELDPNAPDRLLAGGLSLWRTDDVTTPNTTAAGPSWASIKPAIGNSVRNHAITAIAIADGDSNIAVVGHANGNIYRSTDATAVNPQWTQIDTNGISVNRQCLALTIDPDDHDRIYAAFGGFQQNNLWLTTDGGQSWASMSQGLPEAPIRDVSIHPQRSTWIYIATQVGLFASEDGGTTWSPTNEGPANVACRDLFWMGCRLVCVTHGRGMFEIDLPIANAFPAPVLQFTGTENYTVQGNPFTRYKLSVANRASYPDSLFRPSPDLPPCGTNTNSSRTWVDIFNGDNNQRIYGFCALGSSQSLDQLWFGLPQGDAPPNSVYITLRDRRCPATYTSNTVPITAAVGMPSMTNPVPGATFSGDTVTFEWSANGTAVAQWWLYVGSRLGGREHHDSGSLGTALFETVPGLPRDGSQVFVRLWYRTAGAWRSIDTTYTAALAGPPEITTPLPGATLTGDTVTFEWRDNGTTVAQWWLYVGSSVGARDIYNSGSLGTSLNETVTGLPMNGSTVFVRLWYRTAGAWHSVDSQYTAATPAVPAIVSPAPGSTLPGATVTFSWAANGTPVAQWWLYVGSTQGGNDLYNSGSLGTGLNDTVTGLPTDGSDVWVRLWYRSGGAWLSGDFQFRAA